MKNLLVLIIIITVIFTLLGIPLITSVILDVLVLGLIIIFSWIHNKNKPKKENDVLRNNITESKLTDKILFVDSDQINENIHTPNNLFIDKMNNIDLSNQTPTDINLKNNKQEKLSSILKDLIVYSNNKDVINATISNRTPVKSEQIDMDFQIRDFSQSQKVQKKNGEEEFEKKRILGNILNSLITYKKDKYLTESKAYNHLHVDDESIIDITDMESYKLDYNDFYPENIPMYEDRVEIERDLYGDKSIDTTLPDYSEFPFKFVDRDKELELIKYSQSIPYWSHTYIYSVSTLQCTSQSNQGFYKEFKKAFYEGIYYDLEDNSNYYFTLLFDLLDEYEKHKNIIRLENQLCTLSKCYPKTKAYAIDNLLKLLNKNKEASLNISRLIELYPDYHWGLGDKYAVKLNLAKKEKKLLNDSVYSTTSFTSIEKCQLEVVKLFLYAIRKWNLNKLEETIRSLSDLIVETYFKRQGYTPPSKTVEREIFYCVYKCCENYIRVQYGFRGKVYLYTSYYTEKPYKLIAQSIINPLEDLISTYDTFSPLDQASEIQLNLISPTRWRDAHEKLIDKFDGNLEILLNGLKDIYRLNENNANIKQMYYDTMKLIFSSDSPLALKLYIEYISINMQDTEGKEKALPKYICKKLFKRTEQQDEFEVITKIYKSNRDKINAYSAIDELFAPKRKKLNLNTDEISKIAGQHSDTVKLLNEVMDEDQIIIVKQTPVVDKVQSNSTNNSGSGINSILDSEQQELLDIFVENNYTLKKSQVETFAKSKNLMANRLIEKINDQCYEVLDDVLIEDEDDSWTILEEYLEKILVK